MDYYFLIHFLPDMVYFVMMFLLCGCCCWCMYDEHLRGLVDEVGLMGSRCCCRCRVHASVVPMVEGEEVNWREGGGEEVNGSIIITV